jgi:flagellar hook-associated protein 3 FlgL
MSISPLQPAGVSTLQVSDAALQSINSAQTQLLQVENQISTGKQLNVPSDNPGASAVVVQLQQTLNVQQTYSNNITQATSQLGETDNTLGTLTGLLQQAQSLASQDVNTGVSAAERQQDASTVQSIYNQALSLANSQFNGVYLYGGDQQSTAPYVASNGGVQFVGSSNVLSNQVNDNLSLPFQVSGPSVFGSTSQTVNGTANLTPQVTANTRLADLSGGNGDGIRLGAIQISNGATTQTVDLTHADSVGDVIDAINNAGVGNITATIGPNGALTLGTTGNDDISVTNVAGDTTASDLGIQQATGAGAGQPVNGASLGPLVSPLTPISALNNGQGIDTTDGMVITNGAAKATIKFTSPPLPANPNVQDMLNAINGAGVYVDAQINAAGTGIDITNNNQGTQLTIAENGGTTATDLGVRTFAGNTPLSQLNNGQGVTTGTGPSFTITRADGSTFSVNISGAVTIQDVINEINAADTNNGAQPPELVASLAANGNGITLTDSTGGAGTVSVAAINGAPAATQLGLIGTGATANANTLTGADVNPVAAQGIFSDLANLRDALSNNDVGGITAAAQGLAADQQQVIDVRAQAGSTSQALAAQQTEITSQGTATTTLISNLQDTDLASAITNLTTLQTTLEASMQAESRTLSLNLMDFLQ